MSTIRMKVTFIQGQQSEGQQPIANVRLQEVVAPSESPQPMNPYGTTNLSLVLSGDEADAYVVGAEYDVTIAAASGT